MDDTDNTGNELRLQMITNIQQQLETEKEKRKHLSKIYKKCVKVTNALDYILATSIMGLSAVGVGLLATIIAAPAVITTETVTVGASILFILNKQVYKKLLTKSRKHEKIGALIEETLIKISNHLSIALNDDKISAEEYDIISSEYRTFLETKQTLRATSKESVKNCVENCVENNVKNNVENNVKNSV